MMVWRYFDRSQEFYNKNLTHIPYFWKSVFWTFGLLWAASMTGPKIYLCIHFYLENVVEAYVIQLELTFFRLTFGEIC